ncbi:MAG TPA: hypothetical protein VLA16_01115 [Ideonella sp.]|nr:hypothetical protein [Ideonella sp.]
MAIYSERYRCIFFANPQTGSKAIAKTLKDKLEGVAVPAHEVVRDGQVIVRGHHATYQQLIDGELMSADQLAGLLKFTGVRNPFDLLVSRYLKRRGRFVTEPEKYQWAQRKAKVKASMEAAQEQPFAQWIVGQLSRLADKERTAKGPFEFLDHADIVIRFEALQAGFDQVLDRIGVTKPVEIAPFNVTAERTAADAGSGEAPPAEAAPKRHYTEFYDDTSRALVARVYAPVIERFGYTFG